MSTDRFSAAAIQAHADRLAGAGVDVVRICYPDLHGLDRSRDILLPHLAEACRRGLTFCRSIYRITPSGTTVQTPGASTDPLSDMCVYPDLETLVQVPWEPGVAWCLGDPVDPATTRPVPESPRDVLRTAVAALATLRLRAVIGPELEYFLLDPDPGSPQGWRPYRGQTGNVYSSARRGDPDGHLLRSMRQLHQLGIGVTAGNQEFEPGQFEINLDHSQALDAADRAFRFKAAVRELARTEERLATFMAKPFNGSGSSGFHLHVSCTDESGQNLFDDPHAPCGLSATARHAIAGVLRHAPALCALLNPTINSYRRLQPGELAPRFIDWGENHRNAMVRIPPERGFGTRMELRLGDASANPYLAIAGLTAAMYLGLRAEEEPPAPSTITDNRDRHTPPLPPCLDVALDSLQADDELTEVLGKQFTAAYIRYKRDEIQRFQTHVTDWEFSQYAQHV